MTASPSSVVPASRSYRAKIRAISLVPWLLVKGMSTWHSFRFGKRRGAPAGALTTDDGRYDYGLSQPEYGIIFERDVVITLSDGTRLRGDVFRPDHPGQFPAIMASAPYPRYVQTQPGLEDSGGVGSKYQLFEQANPEFWVPRGYAYVTVSPRGFAGSEGSTEIVNEQEAHDFAEAIDWAATREWCDGNVGLWGISYYAFSQYWVASLRPPHLKAIVPWEGLSQPYQDTAFRGGIPSMFGSAFVWQLQVIANNPFTSTIFPWWMRHSAIDSAWEERTNPRPQDIDVPMLSVGGLNDPDLHLRGNVRMFAIARSAAKRLLLYSGTHWGSSYQPWANRVSLRFFDHHLKSRDTGLDSDPAVDIQLRTGAASFTHLYGASWPLPDTEWTRLHLDANAAGLGSEPPTTAASVQLRHVDEPGVAHGEQVTLVSDPLEADLQVAGPLAARLWISSTGTDADLIVELRDFAPDGTETRFPYARHDGPDEPVTRGWLRASHRTVDPLAVDTREPVKTHTDPVPLTPGEPTAVDVEIWPTAMLFRRGHRIGLTIRKGPYKRVGEMIGRRRDGRPRFLPMAFYQTFTPKTWRRDRVSLHTGPSRESWLELPVIPPDPAPRHRIAVTDAGFAPESSSAQVGDRVEWVNDGEDYRSATEASGLRLWDSQLIRGTRSTNPETWWCHAAWAGTHEYRDHVGGSTGTLAVAPLIRTGASGISLVLASETLPPGTGFQVQAREAGGDWQTLATGVSDEQFPLPAAPLSEVRARLETLAEGGPASGWSPPTSTATTQESDQP